MPINRGSIRTYYVPRKKRVQLLDKETILFETANRFYRVANLNKSDLSDFDDVIILAAAHPPANTDFYERREFRFRVGLFLDLQGSAVSGGGNVNTNFSIVLGRLKAIEFLDCMVGKENTNTESLLFATNMPASLVLSVWGEKQK